MFNNWRITIDGCITQGEIDENLKIPQEKWTPQQWATIMGNELSDANAHSLADIPDDLLNSMLNANIEDHKIIEILKDFWKTSLKTLI